MGLTGKEIDARIAMLTSERKEVIAYRDAVNRNTKHQLAAINDMRKLLENGETTPRFEQAFAKWSEQKG